MTGGRGLGPADQNSVDLARQSLAESKAVDFGTADMDVLLQDIAALQTSVQLLLRVLDSPPPRSERLTAARDQEFLNLARAARMEIHAAAGSIKRLDAFEQALTAMLYPESGR
ncbi:hypothetical protein [Streptomyces enissocaesilis]|uniref:Uncharacterized protein n=1 Tax=Streptomyces enissocaesilis TaxID=332589 RepID=A0ABP6K8J2_9ACTN